jgi:acetyl esterase/lipase
MTKYSVILIAVMLATASAARAQTTRSQPPQTAAQTPADSTPKAAALVQQDVPYATVGGHPLLLDVYQPGDNASGLHSAVILIHGGSWMNFDKSNMRSMGMFLARCDFVAFSVDYRLYHGTENLWPAQLDDVQRAVRWIRANAEKYHVDPERIGAFGHSAGAQLAALLGMEATRDNSDLALAKYSSTVQAVVDVSGPVDFTSHRDSEGEAFLSKFLGGDYVHHPEKWKDASPVFHVSKDTAPFLILQGTQDEEVPMAQAQELNDKLTEAGVPVKFVKVEDVHTFEKPESRKRLALETQAFFTQYLQPGNAK